MLSITEVEGGLRLPVRVIPRSSRNQLAGEQDGALKVKITAPPVDGEANQALVNFLAEYLKVAKKNIKIIKGETSKTKIIEISGINKEELIIRTGL